MNQSTRSMLLVSWLGFSLVVRSTFVWAQAETIDLKLLAKKTRPSVAQLVISDSSGKEIATATGFLVSADGEVVTNFHVVEKATSAVAKFENGDQFPVEGILVTDAKNDLAILKLKVAGQPFLVLGDSDKAEEGERVAVIGSPLGLEGTLSEGIVSAIRDLLSDNSRWIQITAPISHGSSGSPVLNGKGEVIGVVSFFFGDAQALNFAVPSDAVRKLLAVATTTSTSLADAKNSADDAIYLSPAWREAETAAGKEDWANVHKAGQELVRVFPDHYLSYFTEGRACVYLGFLNEAVAAQQQAIKLKPEFAPAWNNLGAAYGQQGNTNEEIAAYRQAVKLKPDFSYAWYNLGVAYGQQGKTADEIAAYRQAIAADSHNAAAWYNLGCTYLRLGRKEEAIAAWRQAVKIRPNYAQAWNNLSVAYNGQGKATDAIDAGRQAVKSEPDYATGWYNLAVAYRDFGHRDDAIAAWQQAAKLKPDLAEAWYNLGVEFSKAGRTAAASAAFAKARGLKPELFQADK